MGELELSINQNLTFKSKHFSLGLCKEASRTKITQNLNREMAPEDSR